MITVNNIAISISNNNVAITIVNDIIINTIITSNRLYITKVFFDNNIVIILRK